MLVLTYIDISAVTYGVSPEYSFYLVAIANACSAVGRLVAGFVTDKSGQYELFRLFLLSKGPFRVFLASPSHHRVSIRTGQEC